MTGFGCSGSRSGPQVQQSCGDVLCSQKQTLMQELQRPHSCDSFSTGLMKVQINKDTEQIYGK